METTATQLAGQRISIAHLNSALPRPASRRPVMPTLVRQSTAQDTRRRVGQAFRDMAHGAAAPHAEAETHSFYRSGGRDWAQALGRPTGAALRARVVEAFRSTAHGAQDVAAQAGTMRFYRSSGLRWAKHLG